MPDGIAEPLPGSIINARYRLIHSDNRRRLHCVLGVIDIIPPRNILPPTITIASKPATINATNAPTYVLSK